MRKRREQDDSTRAVVPVVATEMDRLLSVHEVAVWLGLHEKTVYELAKHELGCVRLGRTVRFQRSAVETWIAARSQRGGRDL